jgi:uncharacterized protein YndB with AHSA1/START domain
VKRDLRFEAVYPNRLEEVWHALADSGSLADWLMENDFKPLPGHKFHFRSKSRFGIERLIPCEVLVVDEPRLLSWNWGDEGSVVTFRLEPNNQFNQNLPELGLIEEIQQVAMKRDESLSPSLFTFGSHFAAIRRD